MSIAAVKPYFEARCRAVGMKKHPDAFNEENIPSSTLDETFHVLLGSFSGVSLNQAHQVITAPVTVSFWLKGYRDPDACIDRAVQKADALIKETLKNSNRLGTIIKNVSFSTMSLSQQNATDDNVVKVTLDFTALVMMEIS